MVVVIRSKYTNTLYIKKHFIIKHYEWYTKDFWIHNAKDTKYTLRTLILTKSLERMDKRRAASNGSAALSGFTVAERPRGGASLSCSNGRRHEAALYANTLSLHAASIALFWESETDIRKFLWLWIFQILFTIFVLWGMSKIVLAKVWSKCQPGSL